MGAWWMCSGVTWISFESLLLYVSIQSKLFLSVLTCCSYVYGRSIHNMPDSNKIQWIWSPFLTKAKYWVPRTWVLPHTYLPCGTSCFRGSKCSVLLLRVLLSKGGGRLNIFNLFTHLSTATTVIRLGHQLLQWFVSANSYYSDLS